MVLAQPTAVAFSFETERDERDERERERERVGGWGGESTEKGKKGEHYCTILQAPKQKWLSRQLCIAQLGGLRQNRSHRAESPGKQTITTAQSRRSCS